MFAWMYSFNRRVTIQMEGNDSVPISNVKDLAAKRRQTFLKDRRKILETLK